MTEAQVELQFYVFLPGVYAHLLLQFLEKGVSRISAGLQPGSGQQVS